MKKHLFKFFSASILSVFFALPAYAGHLFTQGSTNTPVLLNGGTGVNMKQLAVEGPGTTGNVSINFGGDWNAGDSLRITIGNYTQTFSYDTPLTGTSQSGSSLFVADPVLAALTLSPTVASSGIPRAYNQPSGSIFYGWTFEALTGSFTFIGYRIYFAGATFNGSNSDLINQSSVVSSSQLVSNPNSSLNTTNTLVSLAATADHLRSIYANQTAAQVLGLNYDCDKFGANHLCLTTAGRLTNTFVDSTGSYFSSAAVLIGSYMHSKQLRIGAWADQTLNRQDNLVKLQNSNPMVGLFAVYNPTGTELGDQYRLSVSYVSKAIDITRPSLLQGTEPGQGTSRFHSLGFLAEYSYGIAGLLPATIVKPFLGYRDQTAYNNSYSEAANNNSSITKPITFDKYESKISTVFAGVRTKTKYNDYQFSAELGIESDLSHNTPTLSGTSEITGMSSFAVLADSKPRYKRGFASTGVTYDFDKSHRVGLSMHYRQDLYYRVDSLTSFLSYTASF